MTRPVVDIAFGYTLSSASPVWTDVTQYADLVRGIDITRGAQDELSETQPGTCSITLDNSDGRFTSGRTASPYFPNVKKNVPIRVRAVTADQNLITNPSFESGLADWEHTATPTFVQDATHVKQGSQAMRVTWGGVAGQSVYTEVYGLDIGTRYTASAHVWVPSGGAPTLVCGIEGIGFGAASSVLDGWSRITFTFTATDTRHRFAIEVASLPTAGTQCWIDAVQLWEGSTALPLNHLANGDFETSVANWVSSGTPTFARSTTRAFRGASSMQVTWGTVADQTITCDAMTGLVIGQAYTYSAYVWVPSGGTPVALAVAGLSIGSPSTLVDRWQRITISWTATATSHQVRLRHGSGVTPVAGQVWMDAAMVAEGSTPVDFTTLDGAQIHPRYFGMVTQWPVEWKGLYSTATITCTDVFTWASLAKQLKPMLVQEVLLDQPIAYYPLSEPDGSASAGDLAGTQGVGSLTVIQAGAGGTLTFGAGTGPAGAGTATTPEFTPSSSTAGKYLQADLGPTVEATNGPWRVRIEAWFTTSTNGRVLLGWMASDATKRNIISLESGTGKVQFERETYVGGPLTAVVLATPNLADGILHHILLHEAEGKVFVDGVEYALSTLPTDDMRILQIGGFQNSRLWSGTIAHVALYLRPATSAELVGHYTTGSTAHVGETADDRLARLASYAGLTVTTQGTTFDAMASQAELGKSALEHQREVERTESGKLLASRASAALLFQSRDLRYNPVPAISLAYGDLETDGVKYADDDQKMVNDVTASRVGGATQRVISQASIDTYGPKPRDLELYKNTDNAASDAANWLVSRYADPPSEIRQVPVEAYSMPLATYRALLNADVSTVLALTSLPDQAPASTATSTIEGYTERIGLRQHHLDFHTSRAATDTVWVLDDPTYSILDSTTRLAY
ncbi:carbohydrate binding domain-containing protein [Streptomyces blattellae]|uniref:carbohydrate binding domain-containing protein n=1 Tax=Streptomyces blattellae TaxID=2569855 RepID=UPI0012B6DFBD|nr:carbohydrate binding domain-containing protein [Streptomyces blattellae]